MGFEPPPILELRIYELRIGRIHLFVRCAHPDDNEAHYHLGRGQRTRHPLLILHFIPNQKGTSATRS